MSFKFTKLTILASLAAVFLLIGIWGVFAPVSLGAKTTTVYTVEKGMGYKQIGADLEKVGIIHNHGFFTLYALATGSYGKLQAGAYEISPSMSVAQIVKKMVSGDVIENSLTIIEGWNLQDIASELESKKIMTSVDFLAAAKVAPDLDFLKDKPAKLSLEGYIFPDTYEFPIGAPASDLVKKALANFDKKLTPELRQAIVKQHKTIFQIVTMASIIEKEVQTPEDKKMVSGILWKRIKAGMPLQVDATVHYAIGNNNPLSVKDLKINSPYNTYNFPGLPQGPISNPGIDSITATIYPVDSPYWYY
ncbi:MAG: endolytic transglycosylase MltG, partial [Candidatus Paceibacterales bacterium]